MLRKTSEPSQKKTSSGEEVHCPYEQSGCNKKLTESLMLSHEVNCCYNFKKFGKFVNLCKLLGYFNCGFLINNGNIKAGVEHFQSEHNFILTNKSEAFKMILSGFQKKTSSPKDNQSWTPIILDLKDKLCYLLVVAVTDKAYQSVALSCIFLPYPNNEHLTRAPPLQMEFSMPSNDFTLIRDPIILSNAQKYFEDPDNLPDSLLISTLRSGVAKDGSLTFTCQVKSVKAKERAVTMSLVCKKSDLNLSASKSSQSLPPASAPVSQFIQTLPKMKRPRVKHPVLKRLWMKWRLTIPILLGILIIWPVSDPILDSVSKFNSNNSPEEVVEEDRDFRKFIGQKKPVQLDYSIIDEDKYNFKYDIERNEVIRYIRKVLDVELQLPWEIQKKRANLKKNAHFYLAVNGDVKAIHYLVERGFDVNAVDLQGLSVLDWALRDDDPFYALQKAKCLIETYGADFKRPNGVGLTYLHRVALWGNYEAVEYFLKKGLSPDDYDKKENKPIHYAVWNDEEVSVEIAKLLLEHAGIADCRAKNIYGATPLDLAQGDTLIKLKEVCNKS